MQVVLRKDVENLGLRDEVVTVARGYARNYLLPRGLAELATPGLVAEMARREATHARHQARTLEEAEALASSLTSTELRLDAKAGPTGSLFGSITATNVADELWTQRKVRIDRRKLTVAPIKRIGRYAAQLELFAGVTAELRLVVVPEGGELPPETETPIEEPASTESSSISDLPAVEASPSPASDELPEPDSLTS